MKIIQYYPIETVNKLEIWKTNINFIKLFESALFDS